MKPFPTPWTLSDFKISENIRDLVLQLQKEAGDFENQLPDDPFLKAQLREGVQAMNCYYTNLIEGNNTSLADLSAALETEENLGPRTTEVEEIKAHLSLQKMIDAQKLSFHEGDMKFFPLNEAFILQLHRDFYKETPQEKLFLKNQKGELTKHLIRPGHFRSEKWEQVILGRHTPPPAEDVLAHMQEFCEQYHRICKNLFGRFLGIAAAHHRFCYIHPFMDGNGRVGRLLTHALFRWSGIGVEGLWSISRGLARGLKGIPKSPEYKSQLANTDRLRDGDLDGRGVLSEKALQEFCVWFLEVALDQIKFMRDKFNLSEIEARYINLLERELISEEEKETGKLVVKHILKHGKLEKKDRGFVLGKISEGTARTRLDNLIQKGFLREVDPKNKRSPYGLNFPLKHWQTLFPGLF